MPRPNMLDFPARIFFCLSWSFASISSGCGAQKTHARAPCSCDPRHTFFNRQTLHLMASVLVGSVALMAESAARWTSGYGFFLFLGTRGSLPRIRLSAANMSRSALVSGRAVFSWYHSIELVDATASSIFAWRAVFRAKGWKQFQPPQPVVCCR